MKKDNDKSVKTYRRQFVNMPERSDTARMIVTPAGVVIINMAAMPGCNVDRVFYTLPQFVRFAGVKAACLLDD